MNHDGVNFPVLGKPMVLSKLLIDLKMLTLITLVGNRIGSDGSLSLSLLVCLPFSFMII